jgi:succinate dehydrogenase/fumarate reductase-like Fe-S protein
MVSGKMIKVQIYRSPSVEQQDEAKQGTYKEFEVPDIGKMTVFSVLDYIRYNQDSSLAYYKSCRIGRCSGCIVEVDGKNKLACTTPVKDGMKIGPAKGHRVIRDLVTEYPNNFSFTVRQDKYDKH